MQAIEAFQSGQWARATQLADVELAAQPGNYDALQIKTLAALNAGHGAEALPNAELLLRLFPEDADAHNSHGAVLQVLGRHQDAIAAFRKATALAPQNPMAWLNLAQLYTGFGRHAEAAPCFESVIRAGHRPPEIYLMWASALLMSGKPNESVKALRTAIDIDPKNAYARDGLAAALREAGQLAEAEQVGRETISRGLATPATYLEIATANTRMDRLDAALESIRQAVQMSPAWPQALSMAAKTELTVGSIDAAVEGFRKLEATAPPPDPWRFLRSIAWPAIMESSEQIDARFKEVNAALDELIARPAKLRDPYVEVCMTGFYMAYQGFDDTQLQKKIAQAYVLATPDLEWTAPHVSRPRDRSKRIRLGILSSHLNNHTIGKLNIGIAQKLDRKRFEVVVIRPACPPDFLSGAFDQCAEHVLTVPAKLSEARAKIAEAELDALFHTDIGMAAFTYYLAFARLARVQFTTWGHPVTTGMRSMDYFVSTRHAEPDNAQAYYTERLVPFDNPPSYYYRPRDPSSFDIRTQLGLNAGERIYACLQTLFKMHPDFDRALIEILRRDPKGRVLLVAAKYDGWNAKLKRRIEREGADVADRFVFAPPMPLPDYLAVLRDADALLDTFHFGGGNSSYESFGMSSPVVTLPGERMRARITSGLYARMGQSRWVARSVDHFVDLALELANGESRAAWRCEIAEGADRFLQNEAVIREYEGFLENALA